MITLLSFLIFAMAVESYSKDPWRSVVLAGFALMLWVFPFATILVWLGMVTFKVVFA
jgi:hypothetical protein